MESPADTLIVRMGKVVINLRSLEFLLRFFLFTDDVRLGGSGVRGDRVDYQNLKVGDLVPENAFTSYDDLGKLIDKYNERVPCFELTVDRSVVDLRDALAHGRVLAFAEFGPWHLLKFAKPNFGKPERERVMVTDAVQMNAAWFSEQVKLISTQTQKLVHAIQMVGGDILPIPQGPL